MLWHHFLCWGIYCGAPLPPREEPAPCSSPEPPGRGEASRRSPRPGCTKPPPQLPLAPPLSARKETFSSGAPRGLGAAPAPPQPPARPGGVGRREGGGAGRYLRAGLGSEFAHVVLLQPAPRVVRVPVRGPVQRRAHVAARQLPEQLLPARVQGHEARHVVQPPAPQHQARTLRAALPQLGPAVGARRRGHGGAGHRAARCRLSRSPPGTCSPAAAPATPRAARGAGRAGPGRGCRCLRRPGAAPGRGYAAAAEREGGERPTRPSGAPQLNAAQTPKPECV